MEINIVMNVIKKQLMKVDKEYNIKILKAERSFFYEVKYEYNYKV